MSKEARDIAEKLRQAARSLDADSHECDEPGWLSIRTKMFYELDTVMREAADEIDRLESIVERLSADKIDDLETILLAGSCECREDDEERFGWWYHSCMSDQEHALRELLELGIYELHPKYPAYFRRKPAAAEAARDKEQEKTR